LELNKLSLGGFTLSQRAKGSPQVGKIVDEPIKLSQKSRSRRFDAHSLHAQRGNVQQFCTKARIKMRALCHIVVVVQIKPPSSMV